MGEVIVDEAAGTVTFNDVTITFPFGFDTQSRVGTITISGANGVSNIVLGLSGAGGPPSPPSAVSVTLIDWDATPADPVVTIVDPGGPGEPADWTLALEIPRGEPGDETDFALEDATDLTVDLDTSAGKVVVVNASGDGFEVVTPKSGDLAWPGTSIASTSSSNSTPRLLKTVTIAARPNPYRLAVFAQCLVTGSADTRIDLIAYLGDPDSGGVEIGRGTGIAGANPPVVTLIPAPTPGSDAATYGKVAVNTASTVYLRAVNQGNASANWATAASPQTTLSVEVIDL